MEYIQGEKFSLLDDNAKIFYRHTHNVNDFLTFFANFGEPFILISHNSDGRITDKPRDHFDADIKLMPDNLVHWFGQNVNVKHDKIESIPIGLENSKWFPEIRKIEKLKAKLQNEDIFATKKLLYINHAIQTNPFDRAKPYWLFHHAPFATVVYGNNGQNFDEYLDNIYSHKFVICPEGNGTDTHRLWETLYMGSIPVVLSKTFNNTFFHELPICVIESWEVVTEDFLNFTYESMSKTKYNLRMLDFNYWREKIINKSNEIK